MKNFIEVESNQGNVLINLRNVDGIYQAVDGNATILFIANSHALPTIEKYENLVEKISEISENGFNTRNR